MEKRQEPRVHKFLPVQITDENLNKLVGSSIDVSRTGMRVRLHLRKVLPPGQKVHLCVTDHGTPYYFQGEVCWYRRDVVDNSRYIGVRFDPNIQFNDSVLKKKKEMKPTLTDMAYPCAYASKEEFLKEYLENIIFGGLFVNSQQLAQSNCDLPQMHKIIDVEISYPESKSPFRLKAEVVAQVPGGYGLKLTDLAEKKQRLNAWMR